MSPPPSCFRQVNTSQNQHSASMKQGKTHTHKLTHTNTHSFLLSAGAERSSSHTSLVLLLLISLIPTCAGRRLQPALASRIRPTCGTGKNEA